MSDLNCLSHWFPLIERAGLPVPRTEIVRTELPLVNLLDGGRVDGWPDFLVELLAAADKVRHCWDPFFLRTGHGSGKHEWEDTCYVQSHHSLGDHVYRLVEWSHMADLVGLPTDVWAVRSLIPTQPLFTCRAYGNFPVAREFRYFVRNARGKPTVEHVQPYWPPDAVEQGSPDSDDWRSALADANRLNRSEHIVLTALARGACDAVGGGFWSIDFLRSADGRWWLTDMALGEQSFRWEPDEEVVR